MIKATSGEAKVFELDVNDKIKEIRRRVSLLPQECQTYEKLTAYENILYYGQMHGTVPDEELKKKTTIFVFFESPHRIIPFLQDAGEAFGKVQICVAKEMTKKFEKYYRGVIPEVIERVGEDIVKGEYTIIIDNRAGIGL